MARSVGVLVLAAGLALGVLSPGLVSASPPQGAMAIEAVAPDPNASDQTANDSQMAIPPGGYADLGMEGNVIVFDKNDRIVSVDGKPYQYPKPKENFPLFLLFAVAVALIFVGLLVWTDRQPAKPRPRTREQARAERVSRNRKYHE